MSYVRIPVIEYGGLILLVKWSYLRKTHIHWNWLFGNKIRLLIADQSYCQAVLIVELYCSLFQLYGVQVLLYSFITIQQSMGTQSVQFNFEKIHYENMQTWKKECIHGTFKIYGKKTKHLFQDRFLFL